MSDTTGMLRVPQAARIFSRRLLAVSSIRLGFVVAGLIGQLACGGWRGLAVFWGAVLIGLASSFTLRRLWLTDGLNGALLEPVAAWAASHAITLDGSLRVLPFGPLAPGKEVVWTCGHDRSGAHLAIWAQRMGPELNDWAVRTGESR